MESHYFHLYSSRGVGIEIVERYNYITQGCSLHSFKSLKDISVESVKRDTTTRNKNLKKLIIIKVIIIVNYFRL
jgi:hypothetical protein